MPVWTYSARTVSGDLKRAEYDAASRDEVIAHLRSQRLIPIAIREKPKGIQLPGGQKVKTRDIVILTRQFATMINAGLPLVQALDILAKQSDNKTLQSTLQDVLYDVESGHTLADAMRDHEKVFTPLYVNMVAAGEAGGILDTILLRLAVFLEKAEALARKVKGAMIYPIRGPDGDHRAAAVRDSDLPADVRQLRPGASAAHPDRDHGLRYPPIVLVGHGRRHRGDSVSVQALDRHRHRPVDLRSDSAAPADLR